MEDASHFENSQFKKIIKKEVEFEEPSLFADLIKMSDKFFEEPPQLSFCLPN